MTDVKWQDPPTVGRSGRSSDSDGIVAKLKANPGKWALVRENVTRATGTYLKNAYGLEVTTRKMGPKTDLVNVYARYVAGDES